MRGDEYHDEAEKQANDNAELNQEHTRQDRQTQG
jgi:hypothetical protein